MALSLNIATASSAAHSSLPLIGNQRRQVGGRWLDSEELPWIGNGCAEKPAFGPAFCVFGEGVPLPRCLQVRRPAEPASGLRFWLSAHLIEFVDFCGRESAVYLPAGRQGCGPTFYLPMLYNFITSPGDNALLYILTSSMRP